jgi:hypothetical protein
MGRGVGEVKGGKAKGDKADQGVILFSSPLFA